MRCTSTRRLHLQLLTPFLITPLGEELTGTLHFCGLGAPHDTRLYGTASLARQRH
jgi:hypothetical protein